jgi:hypothetical protein
LEIEYPEDDGPPKIKNSNAHIIEDYSSRSLKKGIDHMVDSSALIITDGWGGYPNAVRERWHEIILSDQGTNFPHLHWHIFNLKNWLRGIHHSVSLDHIAAYLDEFNFRFNKRNHKSNACQLLIQIAKLPWTRRQLMEAV